MVLAAIAAAIAALSLSVAADAAVKRTAVTTTTTSLGKILVDSRGRTLYLFKKDRHGKSACNGQCASFWPLIASGKPLAGRGQKPALLGTTRRKDGQMQVTYPPPALPLRRGQGKGPDERRRRQRFQRQVVRRLADRSRHRQRADGPRLLIADTLAHAATSQTRDP
jgi:predicted lipoprotein with Yx(FWY)xxD motif